jgi:hypothetical protein
MAEDGFLQRWSKRKSLQGLGTPDAPLTSNALPVPGTAPLGGATQNTGVGTSHPGALQRDLVNPIPAPAHDSPDPSLAPNAATSGPPPAPQMADTQALTPVSDFRPFMGQGVAPEVKNAAMKKLFADPHFNVMDRMDIYIDDYSQPDPLPLAMLRQMNGAKFLNLFEDEDKDKDKDKEQAALTPAPAEGAMQTPVSPMTDSVEMPASAHTPPMEAPPSAQVPGEPDTTDASNASPQPMGDTGPPATTLPVPKA